MRPAALRWVLLSALVFALIGMHSLVATGPAHASMGQAAMAGVPAAGAACCADHDLSTEQPGQPSGHAHDPRHLCLAVLVAVVGLVVAWLLWRCGRAMVGNPASRSSGARTGRGPPIVLSTSDPLSSLCVLRL